MKTVEIKNRISMTIGPFPSGKLSESIDFNILASFHGVICKALCTLIRLDMSSATWIKYIKIPEF